MNKTKPDFIFTGQWQISPTEYLSKTGWLPLPIDYTFEVSKEILWRFTRRSRFYAKCGIDARYKESKLCITEWAYYPEENLLYIDTTSYYQDGHWDTTESDHYRVEKISPDEAILYCLEDVKVEPDDYCYRFRIKRLV